jgi:DNA-binding PadR family transcriptional regulator
MAVREAMLALLTDGPRHGYQLKAEFEEALTAPGTLNAGQVYTTLDRLVRDGLVDETDLADLTEPRTDERRKPFQLTPSGREAVRQWLLTGPPPADRSRDELVSRILLAVHTEAVDVTQVIDAQRRALVAQLQDVRQRQRKVEGDLSASLIADALASTLEADLGWLDRAEARLHRPRRRP